jgi:hypothetical protein
MRRYVHLGINPRGAMPTLGLRPLNWNKTLEALIVQHGDWYRYSSQNYVLFTESNLAQLAGQIRALPGFQAAYVLLAELPGFDPERCNGWMDPKFWAWLQGSRDIKF